jgi:hypothetical protein
MLAGIGFPPAIAVAFAPKATVASNAAAAAATTDDRSTVLRNIVTLFVVYPSTLIT